MLVQKPLYILHPVDVNDGSLYLPKPVWLDDFIKENYQLFETRDGYFIYKKNEKLKD